MHNASAVEKGDRIRHLTQQQSGTVEAVWPNRRHFVVALIHWDNGSVTSLVLSRNDQVELENA